MSDLDYWTKARKAEQELEAATTRTAINAAAEKLMLAKPELKRLERPVRLTSRPMGRRRVDPVVASRNRPLTDPAE